MNQFFKEIEAALLTTATQYAPEGSEPKVLDSGLSSYKTNMKTHHCFLG